MARSQMQGRLESSGFPTPVQTPESSGELVETLSSGSHAQSFRSIRCGVEPRLWILKHTPGWYWCILRLYFEIHCPTLYSTWWARGWISDLPCRERKVIDEFQVPRWHDPIHILEKESHSSFRVEKRQSLGRPYGQRQASVGEGRPVWVKEGWSEVYCHLKKRSL